MAVTAPSHTLADIPARARAGATASRVSRAGVLLGTLGLAACAFLVLSWLETWRLSPAAGVGHLSIFGQRVSYPHANLAALLVLLLAGAGLGALALALAGTLREAVVARRFGRRLSQCEPRRSGDVWVIEDDRPLAFCAGLLLPRVYVSTAAVALLDEAALDAVLLHEHHHARRRDPLRLAVGRVLARSLFFMPGLGELVRRGQTLAEVGADEAAIDASPDNRAALASAMLSFSQSGAGGFDAERVDHLLGESPAWRFPAMLCVVAGLTLLLIVALATLAGRVAAGSATLALPFLSNQPCVLMLALIPAVLALTGLRIRRQTHYAS